MTSTVTNYSNLIDTSFPVPGVDNDTQGFRNNSMNIQQALDTAATEITNLQTQYGGLVTQINDATVIGDNFAAIVASTVTTIVVNSLSNYNPDIVSSVGRRLHSHHLHLLELAPPTNSGRNKKGRSGARSCAALSKL